MKSAVSVIAAGVIAQAAAAEQTTWVVDNAHSSVKFAVSHMVISEVEGSFNAFSGTLSSRDSGFEDASVEFSADIASINTNNQMRDKHLASDDFFNAGRFPHMTFRSASWKKKEGNTFVVEGDLTIRNVTKRVSFDVVYGGTARDPYGNTKAGFRATATINRFDFGLKWNALTEAGGAMVGKEVHITLLLELARQKES